MADQAGQVTQNPVFGELQETIPTCSGREGTCDLMFISAISRQERLLHFQSWRHKYVPQDLAQAMYNLARAIEMDGRLVFRDLSAA